MLIDLAAWHAFDNPGEDVLEAEDSDFDLQAEIDAANAAGGSDGKLDGAGGLPDDFEEI